MADYSDNKKLYFDYTAIVVCSLIINGLLLLNDGIYWDGWLIYTLLIDKDWHNLYSMFSSVGAPIGFLIHRSLAYSPNIIFGYKLVAFLSLTFIAILIYMICNELRERRSLENFFIAVLSISYPAYQVSFELVMVPALVFYCLFFFASFLVIKAHKEESYIRYIFRMFSLMMFLICFSLESLLVLYYGCLLTNVFYVKRIWDIELKEIFKKIIAKQADYIFLPVFYWVVKQIFFPAHGSNAGYNEILFDTSNIIQVYKVFFENSVFHQIREAVTMMSHPIYILVALVVIIWSFLTTIFDTSSISNNIRKKPYAMLLFGLVFFVFAIFPYAVVGKAPTVHGWNTRHAILLALPISIIIVSTSNIASSIIFHLAKVVLRKDKIIIKCNKIRIQFGILFVLFVAFTISTIENYITWQARWVKDRSVLLNLTKIDKAKDISIFWINSRFKIGDENHYRFYEWSSMFKYVWGDESHIGLFPNKKQIRFLNDQKTKRFYNKRYNLSGFNPNGRQATLEICRGFPENISETFLVAKYFFYKYFKKDRLVEFLSGVTNVKVIPIILKKSKLIIRADD